MQDLTLSDKTFFNQHKRTKSVQKIQNRKGLLEDYLANAKPYEKL